MVVTQETAILEDLLKLHQPIGVYDECQCPEGSHPEEFDYIDCEDYSGCPASFTHWACNECCTAGAYITEECSEGHPHSKDKGQRCPTVALISRGQA